MGELDDLLAELKAEYSQPDPPKFSASAASGSAKLPQKPSSSPLDQLLAEVKTEVAMTPLPPLPLSSSSLSEKNSPKTHSILEDLKADHQEEVKKEQKRLKQEQEEQAHLEQVRKQRKRQILTRSAQEWLNQLDPKSEEGRWFEEFSCSYSSRLQAAIDYLEALKETQG